MAWTFEGEREIHSPRRDTWDVRGESGDTTARTLEDGLRVRRRLGELQEIVLRTLTQVLESFGDASAWAFKGKGRIHDQLEDRWRINGETYGSKTCGDRRKRRRETGMEDHENR